MFAYANLHKKKPLEINFLYLDNEEIYHTLRHAT